MPILKATGMRELAQRPGRLSIATIGTSNSNIDLWGPHQCPAARDGITHERVAPIAGLTANSVMGDYYANILDADGRARNRV